MAERAQACTWSTAAWRVVITGAIACGGASVALTQGVAMAQGVTPGSRAVAPPTEAGSAQAGAQAGEDQDVWRGLVMRSGQEPPVGRPISLGIEGITVEVGEGVAAKRFLVGLDRIAEPPAMLAKSFAPLRGISERAWRARIRLERGDLVASEPLLEDLSREIGAARGATPELVHRGLLACRLARGVHTGALESYIRWRLASEGLAEESTSGAGLEAAIDPSTRLATQLPPMWIDGPATQAFARSKIHVGDGATGAAAALARLYETAAKIASGEPVTDAWDPLGPGVGVGSAAVGDEGVSLVRDIVAARLGDDAGRAKARNDLLRRRNASIPAWQHAWILTGVGQSLTHEKDRELRLRGVATLLEVATRYEDACPYLTGLAMADAAITLGDLGDVASALRIRSDLAGRWPGHVALDLPALRSLIERPTAAATPAALPEPPGAKTQDGSSGMNEPGESGEDGSQGGNSSVIEAPEEDVK